MITTREGITAKRGDTVWEIGTNIEGLCQPTMSKVHSKKNPVRDELNCWKDHDRCLAVCKRINIEKTVDNFPTKSLYGFNYEEQKQVIAKIKNLGYKLNMKRYEEAMTGNTCMIQEGEIIMYPCDIIKALKCAVENRGLRMYEWD